MTRLQWITLKMGLGGVLLLVGLGVLGRALVGALL